MIPRLGPTPIPTFDPSAQIQVTAPPATPSPTPEPSVTQTAIADPMEPDDESALGDPVQPLRVGFPVSLEWIQMIDGQVGWGIANGPDRVAHVLRSTDGGFTWRDATPPEPAVAAGVSGRAAAAAFLDSMVGWVFYYPNDAVVGPVDLRLWRTGDGGASWTSAGTWQALSIEEGVPQLHPIDDRTAWLFSEIFLGAGHHAFQLSHTTDGGSNWAVLHDPPETESLCHRTGIDFFDSSVGWLTSDCPFEEGGGLLERTLDGGRTWQTLELPAPSEDPGIFDSPDMCSASQPQLFSPQVGHLILECRRETAGGMEVFSFRYISDDGGQTWAMPTFPGGRALFLDRDYGWALNREIHWTEDGGWRWSRIKAVFWDGQFSFIDRETGWAVARNEGAIALVRTRNGGASWELLEPVVAP